MKDLKKSFFVLGNNIVGFGGSGEENTIESISVNGVDIAPDENKNVDITVPSIDGLTKDADLATVAKSGDYKDLDNKPEIPSIEGLAKTTDIPTKVSQLENDSNYLSSIPEEYITETELNAKGYLTEHQDLSAYATKDEIPTVPNKVSELTNDSNYQTAEQVNSAVTTEIAKVVADAPEDFNTLKEMSDWIAGHEDDASAMNSAISDNKTAIAALQTGKADKSEIPTTVAELSDSADYAKTTDIPITLPASGGNADTVNNHTVETDVPVDAVFTDTIYDDTEVKENIVELNSNLVQLELSDVAGGKNLLKWNTNKTITYNGVTFDATQNGKLKLSGTSSSSLLANVFRECTFTLPQGTYTISSSAGGNTFNLYAIDGDSDTLLHQTLNGTFTLSKETEIFLGKWTASGTDMNYDIDLQIEEGDTATPYEPYIPSVKMLAEGINQQNESLSDYGLNNIFDGNLEQGTYNDQDGTKQTDHNCVRNTNKISCKSGDKVILITETEFIGGNMTFYNGDTFVSSYILPIGKYKSISAVIPNDVNKVCFTIYKPNVTISEFADVQFYINNSIYKLSDDVAELNSNLSELVKIKKSIIGDGVNDLDGIIYFNDNEFPVYIRIVGDTKTNNSSYAYLSFEIGGRTFPVDGENTKYFTNQSFDETFTIPSGSYLAFLNQRNVTSNFEIYSANVTSNVINNVNESLDDYGLDNKFDGVWNAGSLDEFGNFYTTSNASTSNYIPCNPNSDITIKVSNVTNSFDVCIAEYTDSSFIKDSAYTIEKGKQYISIKVSSTTKRIRIVFYSVVPSSALQLNTAVYLNNAIDELKNDLSSLGYEIAFGDVDFNNLTNKMVYAINGTCTNAPKTTPIHGILIVFKTTNDIISQLYHDSDGTLYNRMCWGGTWGSWK